MSWLSRLLGGSRPAAGGASRMIVDGFRWMDGRGGDRQSPRDQVQILQMIARFARQEKIETQVVFEGRPLREVSEDGEYNGLKVFFTEKQGSAGDLALARARSTGTRGLVLFTADAEVEQKAAAMGCVVMHTSTLRKAIEGGGQAFGEQQGGAPMRRGGDQRRRAMGNRPSQRPPPRPPAPAESSNAGTAPAVQPANQAVRNLIDLVEEPVRPAVPPPAPAPATPPTPEPAPQPPPPSPPVDPGAPPQG